jgi:hypothetical protein
MKILLLLVSTLISFHAWSFEYKIDQASLLDPSPLQIYKIGKIFSANGYHSMSDMNLTQAGFAFDRVFVSHRWQSGLVLKAGLKVPTNLLGKVMEDRSLGIQVLHFEIENTPYMVMGIDMTHGEFREAVSPWITSSDTSMKWGWVMPRAYAVTCNTMPANAFKRTASDLESNSILRAIGKCGADALGGAVGSVGSTFNFFKRLATEPGKLWEETKQSFVDLKNFVMNIGDELSSAYAAFTGLTAQEKLDIACVVAGQAAGTIAQAALGGAALAKLFPSLMLKVKAGLSLIKKVGELSLKGIKLPNKSFLMREAMSCAL